ncbi:hypothetical protein [Desulfovibrio inopinatus]|uniref:hypothetical protein n=1 Tax=Desulfovibrio inopinatus TaxID=102109 RepID=UPI0003F59052|nr:hypothetical protein [Desulfovibrio inopinatus]
MKAFVLSLAMFMAATPAFAGLLLGAEDFSKGAMCCVEKTCVITKSEADCTKIGGNVVKDCKECAADEKK